jgi:Phosphotransferase enzyme family
MSAVAGPARVEPPPPDPALGPIATALDGDAVGEIVGAARCVPRYAKYRPGRRLLVLYELDNRRLAHLTMLPPHRAVKLWARVAASGLLERVPGGARRVPELGGVLQRYPVDVRLPGLVEASVAAELVRYKPGRRAVLRYQLDGRAVYGKLRADDAGAGHLRLARRLRNKGIQTPEPLRYEAHMRMAVHGEAPGTRLSDLRGEELDAWMEPVAEALERLHAAPVPELLPHSTAREVEELHAAAATAAALLPHRRAAVEELATRIAAALETSRTTRTIHGSFHDDQVLVGDAGVVLLDLDSAASGDPLLDVGHFASYLSAEGQTTARARFLDAYGSEAPLHEAAALLRWSSLPFRRLEPGWPAAMERRLDLAASTIR